MSGLRDEFLSEEDLDLLSLTPDELDRTWMEWLTQAQVTNDRDAGEYAHGVFAGMDLTRLFAEYWGKPSGSDTSSG